METSIGIPSNPPSTKKGTKRAEVQARRELRAMLEALGSTPSNIISNLGDQKCRFGVVGSAKGCIMQQFFKKNGRGSDADFGLLGAIRAARPRNLKALLEVVNINDVLKP